MSDLRSRVVEAGARAICREVFGDEWDGEVPLVQRKQAGRYLDAMLDCLTENREEHIEAVPGWGYIGERLEEMELSELLAILRNPAEDPVTP